MQLESASWLALGASVIGTSHIARSAVCDDSHFGVVLEDGTMLLAVGDGAGSAIHSATGSLRAVQSSVQFLANHLSTEPPCDDPAWEEMLRETVVHAREQIEDLVRETEGASLRDFATTLLLMVITGTHIATLQIGDGAIVLQRTDATLEVLSPAPTGEYINETTFLTSSDPLREALITSRQSPEVDAVALFTDGVQFLAIDYAANTAHLPFFAPLFRFVADAEANPEELTAMLASERVNQLTDDDKTLVIAVRKPTFGAA
jgi:hypothetical protein